MRRASPGPERASPRAGRAAFECRWTHKLPECLHYPTGSRARPWFGPPARAQTPNGQARAKLRQTYRTYSGGKAGRAASRALEQNTQEKVETFRAAPRSVYTGEIR